MATISLTTIAEPYGTATGNHRSTMGLYTGPASYPNGADDGDSFTPSEVGLGVIDFLIFDNPDDGGNPADMRAVKYNYSTNRVLWFTTSDGEQVANATNLSAFTCRFLAIGR